MTVTFSQDYHIYGFMMRNESLYNFIIYSIVSIDMCSREFLIVLGLGRSNALQNERKCF